MTTAERFVIDASVGVKWVVPEPDSDGALALLAAGMREEAHFIAPDVFLPEVTNALRKHVHLTGKLTHDEARGSLEDIMRTLPDLTPSVVLAAQALELALEFEHPAQDCLYVALAIQQSCAVVTADQGMLRKFAGATGRVVHVNEFAPSP